MESVRSVRLSREDESMVKEACRGIENYIKSLGEWAVYILQPCRITHQRPGRNLLGILKKYELIGGPNMEIKVGHKTELGYGISVSSLGSVLEEKVFEISKDGKLYFRQ